MVDGVGAARVGRWWRWTKRQWQREGEMMNDDVHVGTTDRASISCLGFLHSLLSTSSSSSLPPSFPLSVPSPPHRSPRPAMDVGITPSASDSHLRSSRTPPPPSVSSVSLPSSSSARFSNQACVFCFLNYYTYLTQFLVQPYTFQDNRCLRRGKSPSLALATRLGSLAQPARLSFPPRQFMRHATPQTSRPPQQAHVQNTLRRPKYCTPPRAIASRVPACPGAPAQTWPGDPARLSQSSSRPHLVPGVCALYSWRVHACILRA
jgi:hypothetical protein